MDSPNLGSNLKKTANDLARSLNDAAHNVSERIGLMQEANRLGQQIATLQLERERNRQAMADLLIRMFDQNSFAEALLRPEYQRIKEIEQEIAVLEAEKKALGAPAAEVVETCEEDIS